MPEPQSKTLMAANRVLQRCDTLAGISSMSDAICRAYLTKEHRQCNQQVMQWMSDAGMCTYEDAAGNCWGSYRASATSAQTLILGSHLDTVPNAGRYDGILGVLCAIEFIDTLHQKGQRLPFNIDVVGFGDEEGVRFGTTLLGSFAVAGAWKDSWFTLQDHEHMSLLDALHEFHGERRNLCSASRAGDNLLAYLELHIEQGPVLEQRNLPVGIVSSIAGARRFTFEVIGTAGHAGTVPMAMRVDALTAAARIILMIEDVARQTNVVATVGRIQALPGSINVIPGCCQFTLDIRSGSDQERDSAIENVFFAIDELKDKFGFTFQFEEIHNASAVNCAGWIQDHIEESITSCDLQPITLVSGAGHDAMAFSDVCDVGMIFVRCKGGISHHPGESVTQTDVAWGIEVLANTVTAMANSIGN